MIFGRKIQAGLDIGAFSLQWAAIDTRSKKCEVWRAPLRVEDGKLDKARLQSLMDECEEAANLWSNSVALGMQGASVISGYLEFPPLRDEELDMAVLSSVSREIPFPISQMEIVHLKVEPLTKNRTAVFYSVWPKDEQQRRVELCESCDLKVKRIEATGIGLTRELFRNRELDPKKFYGLLNVGHEISQIIVVRGGYPYYLRDIPVGGRELTVAISQRGRLSMAEAEAKKAEISLIKLYSSIGAALGELSYEVSRTFKYFERRFKVAPPEAVFLSGGGARIQDYPEWLQAEIDIPVVAETWEGFRPTELAGHVFENKVALGLALG